MYGHSRTRHSEKVYVDNFAWLPINKVNARALRSALAYGDAPSEAKIVGDHVRVPRKFLPASKLERIGEVVRASPTFQTHTITAKTTLRDHQHEPLQSMVESGGGILNLGCGYGKTVIALNFIATKKVKSAVILGNTSLITQWKEEAVKHLDVPSKSIGVVRGSKWEWEDRDIVLISLSTLCRRAKDGRIPEGFCESFGVVIYDECHHLSAPQFSKTCPLFFGERHGLTATPNREDGLEQVFLNHLGKVHFSRVEQDLIPNCYFVHSDTSADARMEEDLLTPKSDRVILDKVGEIHYRKLCSWVGSVDERNRRICMLAVAAASSGRKTLCLTHSVEHARHMHMRIAGSGLATGEVESSLRGHVIRNHDVTFATIDVAAEALDAPELSCLIVMTPFGARVQGNLLQQALGRIQRKHEGKKNPIAFFMYDTRIPMMKGLCWQVRKKLYSWDYPVKEIKLNELTRENLEELL
jgi:superfamily II DNA or RNA helicase